MRKVVIMLLCLTLRFLCSAQDKATIYGKIVDSRTRDGLPSVNVLVKGTYYGAATDLDGNYTIVNVSPGIYTMTYSIIGYKSIEKTGVKVEAGKRLEISLQMDETALTLTQEVLVVGEKPLFDIEETASRRSVTSDEIAVQAVENIKDVVVQQVGVVQSDNEIHIRGGRSYENAYLLDGISVQDPLAGTGFGLQLSAAAIQEVEVITGGFNAEYGQATSGVVNVTTKEGTDRYSGYVGYRQDHFLSKGSPSNFNTDIIEATVSGPEPLTKVILPALGVQIPGDVTVFGNVYVGLTDGFTYAQTGKKAQQLYSSTFYGTRFAPREENNWFALGKITWRPSPVTKLAFSYNQSVSINQNSQTLQTNLEYVESSPGYQYEFQNILDNANTFTHNNIYESITWMQTLSPKVFYELKIGRLFTNLRADANGKNWDEYTEPKDVVSLPVEYYNTSRDTIGVIPGDGFYDTGNALTWHDHHVDETTIKLDVTVHFSEKNKFKSGLETNFQEMQLIDIYAPWIGQLGLNNDIYKVYPAFGALYFQDNITFSGMILNFGMRFDYWFPGKYVDDAIKDPNVITIPDELRQQYMDHTYDFFGRRWKGRISPRLGISHPVSDNQTLFFSYGHFSKRPRPQFVYAKLNPTSAKSTFQKFGNPDLDPETTVAYELGVRNQFTDNDVLTVTAYYKDIFDYVSTRQAKINNARFAGGNFVTYVNQDYARSRGIEAEYKKRIGKWFQGVLTGSYSIATGKSSSADEGLLVARGDMFETIKENYVVWDRPLQVSLNTNFFVAKGAALFGFADGILDNYNLHLRFFYQSGKRYTQYVQSGTLDTGRPEYVIDYNNLYGGIGSDWFWIDMNLEKYLNIGSTEVTISLEVLNLLDNKNAAIIDPVTGQAYEYGDPTPLNWNDPIYPDLQAPISPYPFSPARYLQQRSVKLGISFRF
jgi:outer membrane receptor protein involved in Fe transport